MPSSKPPRRFALLVGVDLYFAGHARQLSNGRSLFINSLQGCVNDVNIVKEFLHDEFQLEQPSVLTSSAVTASDGPVEANDRLPTFANIKREFQTVEDQAIAGDMFFFHFSGHGAELDTTQASPKDHDKDPSLLTVDFCRGEPAVRGWQLNEWLKRLNDKEVQTVVILDSCHSGGAWRDDNCSRTPGEWFGTLNLPADELAIEEEAPVHRAAELSKSWAINAEGFTLMAACESHQRAAEKSINGKRFGAFTHALFTYLRDASHQHMAATYRTIRDQIARQIRDQNPVVYGRDRLLFFGRTEPFSVVPLVARIDDDTVHLPVGIAHGVHQTSEFTPSSMSCELVFSVDEVDDFESRAIVPPELTEALRKYKYQVVPSRWSFGEKAFSVVVDNQLGAGFQKFLYDALETRIASRVEVENSQDSESNGDYLSLRKSEDDSVMVYGPTSLIGYEGPVRGLSLKHDNEEELATMTAIALSHLGRFGQILALRDEASCKQKPFTVSINPKNAANPEGPFPAGQQFEFTFRNSAKHDLHLTVVSLDSGFQIQQLYPANDHPETVGSGKEHQFEFNLEIPEKLQTTKGAIHRDIIRTIITTTKPISWKSLELPEIWDAAQVNLGGRSSLGRLARVIGGDTWWVEDREILTVCA